MDELTENYNQFEMEKEIDLTYVEENADRDDGDVVDDNP